MNAERQRTFLIIDNQGLILTPLENILIAAGWKQIKSKQEALEMNGKIDFFWMGQSNELGNRFDRDLYKIKCISKNLLWREKSHTTGKDVITNKALLYENMKLQFPEIASKHMAESINIKHPENTNFKITPGQVWVIRPAGHGACSGVGVEVITNDTELALARKSTSKYPNVLLSRYITTPMLWQNRKFHIRAYLLISLHDGFHWSFWNRGKIFTAAEPYNENPVTFRDCRIHDTHGKTTPCDIYFPEDLDLTLKQTDDILHQMRLIMSCAAKIIQPHARKYDESDTAFEVFGVDFMIARDVDTDANQQWIVKLLEINSEAGYGYKNDLVKYTEYCSQYFQWIITNVLDIKN